MLHKGQKISAAHQGGQALFQPIITSHRSPLAECDANGHKSDSTYNSDLDVNRIHLLGLLFKDVLLPPARKGRSETGAPACGKLNVALGGVSCTFKAEIKPYQAYEIWTRVISWDDKWLYMVSHFVRKGSVRPAEKGSAVEALGMSVDGKKVLFASCISKYVFKRGRITVAPAEVLTALGLVPLRAHSNGVVGSANHASDAATATGGTSDPKQLWDWSRVEEERLQGLEVAKHFAGLDMLHDMFSGDSAPALGYFGNLLECENIVL